jgi:AcrR family transcriptional regulator
MATRAHGMPGATPGEASTTIGKRRHDLDSLLAVAVRVFTERGYDGTSMGDIAAASGLSKSSIYHHVEGKEQLLRLALERAVEPLFAVIQEPPAGQGPAISRLKYVVRREVQVLTEQLPYVTLLLRVHGNTETERWALDQRRRFDRFVTGLVAQAASDGDVRTDVDASVVTRLLFGMINSLVEWYDPHADQHHDGADATVAAALATSRTSRAARGTTRATTRAATHAGAPAPTHASSGPVTPEALADAVVRLAFDGLRA